MMMSVAVTNTRTTVRPVGTLPSSGSTVVRFEIESTVVHSGSDSTPSRVISFPVSAPTRSEGRFPPFCARACPAKHPSAAAIAQQRTTNLVMALLLLGGRERGLHKRDVAPARHGADPKLIGRACTQESV